MLVPAWLIILLLCSYCCNVSAQNVECPFHCDCSRPSQVICEDLTEFPKDFHSAAESVTILLSVLPVIPKDAFEHVPNMKVLDIHSVTIGTIETCAFTNLNNMTRIAIYNVKIDNIQPGAFKGVDYDGYFSLYMSEINVIEPFAFNGVHNTKSFTIFGSNITRIKPRAFYNFADLETFALYGSNISHIQSGAFEGMHRIQDFSIRDNNIIQFDCLTVDAVAEALGPSLSYMTVNVVCDCNILWLKKVTTMSDMILNSTICMHPYQLAGRRLVGLAEAEICPTGQTIPCMAPTPAIPPSCEEIRPMPEPPTGSNRGTNGHDDDDDDDDHFGHYHDAASHQQLSLVLMVSTYTVTLIVSW